MRSHLAAAALIALAACSTSGAAGPGPSPSSTKPPTLSVLAQNVVLERGLGTPFVVTIETATPGAQVIVQHDPSANVDVYLLPSATSRITKQCPLQAARTSDNDCVRDIGNGVRETLLRDGPVGAVAVVLRSGAPTVNVRVDFDEGGRGVGFKIPSIAPYPGDAACKDNACNPFFEIMPLRSGTMTATAHFVGGPALMEVLAGRVIAHSATSTGFPYRVADQDRGSGSLRVSTHLDTPAEYALVLQNNDPGAPITGITIDAQWP